MNNRQQTKNPNSSIDLVPVEYDAHGRARRYEVVRTDPQQPTVIDNGLPIVSPLPPLQPHITAHVEGTHMDRARAFGIETLQLSLIVGVLFCIAAWFLADSPLGLLTLALIYGAGFCATWLIAYLAHVLRSPEGVELYGTYRLWNFLDREQSHRWQRAGIEQPRHRLSNSDRLLLALFLFSVMAVIVFVLLHKAAQEGIL